MTEDRKRTAKKTKAHKQAKKKKTHKQAKRKNLKSQISDLKSPKGRPTTYKPEFCEKLIEFFDIEPYCEIPIEHYEYVKANNETVQRVKWVDFKRVPNKLPTLRNFAKSINIPISTVYDWLNPKHDSFQADFSDAFTHAREIRKDFLIQNGLQGFYPPLSFKFVAVNLTDMADKSESRLVDEAGKPLTLDEIKKRIVEAEKVGTGLDKKSIEGDGSSNKTTD